MVPIAIVILSPPRKGATDTKELDMAAANLAQVHKFFAAKTDPSSKDYSLAQFRAEWARLSDTDKAQLREGIGDETFNY